MNKPCRKCEHGNYSARKHSWGCESRNLQEWCERYWAYRDKLFERRKWIPGSTISSMDEVLSQRVVVVNGKPQNIEFVIGWPIRLVNELVKSKKIRRAVPNPYNSRLKGG